MAIDFIVLGGPRSATTWAANWLTTDTTFCLHDPLLEYTVRQLENMVIPGKQRVGMACTSALLYPEWVLSHPAKKIILYRDIEDINLSLRKLGLTELEKFKHLGRIDAMKGVPVFNWEQLFDPKAAQVIAQLLGTPWDAHRHDLLRQMNVQPNWKTLTVGKEAVNQLLEQIRNAR